MLQLLLSAMKLRLDRLILLVYLASFVLVKEASFSYIFIASPFRLCRLRKLHLIPSITQYSYILFDSTPFCFIQQFDSLLQFAYIVRLRKICLGKLIVSLYFVCVGQGSIIQFNSLLHFASSSLIRCFILLHLFGLLMTSIPMNRYWGIKKRTSCISPHLLDQQPPSCLNQGVYHKVL